MKFSREKEEEIIKDYLDGKNTVEIAEKWNTYNTSIRRVLLRNNINIRTASEARRTINTNPFKLGDEYSEYFLGLLLTDGCICYPKNAKTPSVSLCLKDKEMVEEFRNFACPRNKVSKIFNKRSNTYTYSTGARSSILADWLQTYGNFVNKSYECDIYTSITPNILRGIFDGDGYWHHTNKDSLSWGVCGKSLKFLEKIKDYLQSFEINSYISKRKKPENNYLYYIEVYKQADVVKIGKLMYTEAHIYLNRKYETWRLFEETLREKFLKFRERIASSNPEPSYNITGSLIDKTTGRYIIEGAETIIGLLNL